MESQSSLKSLLEDLLLKTSKLLYKMQKSSKFKFCNKNSKKLLNCEKVLYLTVCASIINPKFDKILHALAFKAKINPKFGIKILTVASNINSYLLLCPKLKQETKINFIFRSIHKQVLQNKRC